MAKQMFYTVEVGDKTERTRIRNTMSRLKGLMNGMKNSKILLIALEELEIKKLKKRQ